MKSQVHKRYFYTPIVLCHLKDRRLFKVNDVPGDALLYNLPIILLGIDYVNLFLLTFSSRIKYTHSEFLNRLINITD